VSAELSLPSGLLASLALAEEPLAVFIRHADRHAIPRGESGETTPLTELGETRTRALAKRLNGLGWGLASPLQRCVRTAQLLGVEVRPNSLLGAPGAFVVDTDEGGRVFGQHETPHVVREQLKGETWGCMRTLEEGAENLHALLVSRSELGVAVSHDAIVMPYIRWATGYLFEDDWLEPLDGVVVEANRVWWRGVSFGVPR
jgi:hypothetical protein